MASCNSGILNAADWGKKELVTQARKDNEGIVPLHTDFQNYFYSMILLLNMYRQSKSRRSVGIGYSLQNIF